MTFDWCKQFHLYSIPCAPTDGFWQNFVNSLILTKCRYSDNYKLFFFIFQMSYGPWLMSEFCIHLIYWEQIDAFWWNFVYAVLWRTHEIFPNFSTELWPLIHFNISFFLNIFRNDEWILITFGLPFDIRSMLRLIHVIFPNFSTELCPLIDLRILFMLDILWINWWIWSNLIDTLIFFMPKHAQQQK